MHASPTQQIQQLTALNYVSKTSLRACDTRFLSQFLLHMFLPCPAAISYSVEADGELRKQGLPSRVRFLNTSHNDLDYQYNSTLDLRGQKQATCVMIKAKLKVRFMIVLKKMRNQSNRVNMLKDMMKLSQ